MPSGRVRRAHRGLPERRQGSATAQIIAGLIISPHSAQTDTVAHAA